MKKNILLTLIAFNSYAGFNSNLPILATSVNTQFSQINQNIVSVGENISFKEFAVGEVIDKDILNAELQKVKTKFPGIDIEYFSGMEIKAEDFDRIFSLVKSETSLVHLKDCSDILKSGLSIGNGTYRVFDNSYNSMNVECDMTTSGGGWTLVWHGYPSEARYNGMANEVMRLSGESIRFNQMRMQHVNILRNDYDWIANGELATLKEPIPYYYNQVSVKPDASNPLVSFHSDLGNLDKNLSLNRFLFGYGNDWRVFSSCINVAANNNLFVGGYYPVCNIRNYFNVNSVPDCGSTDRVYCSNAMSSQTKDTTAGITIKELQEMKTWVRKLDIPRTCKEYLDKGLSIGSDQYLIDVDGTGGEAPFKTYCDMTTSGGGWTLVWSNLRAGTNKPTTNLDEGNVLNTRPRCSAHGTTTFDRSGNCSTMDRAYGKMLNYFIGLNKWNAIGKNSQMKLMYLWSADSEVIHQGAIFDLNTFNAPYYSLSLSNHQQIYGSTTPAIFSYHNGSRLSNNTYDRDADGGTNCGRQYSGTPFWYVACWSGSINGGGEFNSNGYYNGAYWYGSDKKWGATNGTGAGNGWIFIREK